MVSISTTGEEGMSPFHAHTAVVDGGFLKGFALSLPVVEIWFLCCCFVFVGLLLCVCVCVLSLIHI